MHRHLVTYACGDECSVYLVSRAAQARRHTLHFLALSFCPDCQRHSRYAAAVRCAEEAGLLPLQQAGCSQHLALAEIIRASLWRLLSLYVDSQATWLLATLFNRHPSAAFWLSLRGLSMQSRGEVAEAVRASALLLWLLQPTGVGGGRDGFHD